MLIEIGNVHAKLIQATDAERTWVDRVLSFEDKSFAARRYGDGRVHLFSGASSTFPAGLVGALKKRATKSQKKVELVDKRKPPVAYDPTATVDWLRDYQMDALVTAQKVPRGVFHHVTGCVAGSTIVGAHRAGRSYKITIGELYYRESKQNPHSRARMREDIKTQLRFRDLDGVIRLGEMSAVVYSGEKETFTLRLADGKEIRATADHRFLTQHGWVCLRDLTPADSVFVEVPRERGQRQKKAQYLVVCGLVGHPRAGRLGCAEPRMRFSVPRHRLVVEADMNGLSFDEYVARLRSGNSDGLRFLGRETLVHHKNEDPKDNTLTNLVAMPVGEHERLHGIESSYRNVQIKTALSRVVSIDRFGVEPTFDICMKSDPHNFVANGFVVHNSGKTEVMVGLTEQFPGRWLILVHKKDLMHEVRSRFLLRNGEEVGLWGDGKANLQRRVTVAMFQSVNAALRTDRTHKGAKAFLAGIAGLIVDECFPAGTLVDGRPIETYKPGDYVTSMDMHTGGLVRSRVLEVFEGREDLRPRVRVHYSDGSSVVCTEGHPFYVAGGHWVPAMALCGHYVLRLRDATHNLHSLPTPVLANGARVPGAQEVGCDADQVLETMYYRSEGGCVLEAGYRSSREGEEVARSLCQESHAGALGAREDGILSESARGLVSAAARWERPWHDTGSVDLAERAWRVLGGGAAYSYQEASQLWVPDRLQGGPSVSGGAVSDRGRRAVSRLSGGAGEGPKEDSPFDLIRVDRVEVLEQGGVGDDGRVPRRGSVYNLHVEDTENYFVDGVLVHNCHVTPAASFWKVTQSCGNAYYRYGFSGTPFARTDSKSLYVVAALGPTIHRISAEYLIKRGFLARPRIQLTTVIHQPAVVRGKAITWDSVYKEEVVLHDTRNRTIATLAQGATKPALLFVKAIAHGKILEKRLRALGMNVEFVWGEAETPQRRAAIKRLVHGDIDVLICNVIFQEGIDIPELRSVLIASGGKSAIMVLQNTGRGTRRHAKDGSVTKDEFTVYDIQDRGCGCGGRHAACKWLEKHTRDRLAAYAMEKYPVFVQTLQQGAIKNANHHGNGASKHRARVA